MNELNRLEALLSIEEIEQAYELSSNIDEYISILKSMINNINRR